MLTVAKEGAAVASYRGAHCMQQGVHHERSESSVHDADGQTFALAADSKLIDSERDPSYQSRLLTVYP